MPIVAAVLMLLSVGCNVDKEQTSAGSLAPDAVRIVFTAEETEVREELVQSFCSAVVACQSSCDSEHHRVLMDIPEFSTEPNCVYHQKSRRAEWESTHMKRSAQCAVDGNRNFFCKGVVHTKIFKLHEARDACKRGEQINCGRRVLSHGAPATGWMCAPSSSEEQCLQECEQEPCWRGGSCMVSE